MECPSVSGFSSGLILGPESDSCIKLALAAFGIVRSTRYHELPRYLPLAVSYTQRFKPGIDRGAGTVTLRPHVREGYAPPGSDYVAFH